MIRLLTLFAIFTKMLKTSTLYLFEGR